MRLMTRTFIAMCLLLVLVLPACSSAPEPPGRDSVILITIDTLRADHLGVYGNGDIKTPEIDRLGREGVVFQNAYAPTHITIPSHVSIFSSRFLVEHGAYRNGKQQLDPDLITLPMMFQEAGYRTAAFSSLKAMRPDWVDGIARGFDTFHYPEKSPEADASQTIGRVAEWIEEHGDRPFFLWVHLFDPHMPYTPPEPYDRMYYDDGGESAAEIGSAVFPAHWYENSFFKDHFINWLLQSPDLNYPAAQYKGEVSFVDEEIGRLRRTLEEAGLGRETWVVLTADHGENLGEHGVFFDHQGLYETTLAVPMIFWHGDRIEPAQRQALTMTIDIMPTLLELTGIEAPPGLSGRSLVPAFHDPAVEIHRYTFAEASAERAVSVSDGTWRYTRFLRSLNYTDRFGWEAGQVELWRLPDEDTNLAEQHPDQVQRFEEILRAWQKLRDGSLEHQERPMTEEEKQLLRTLGYL